MGATVVVEDHETAIGVRVVKIDGEMNLEAVPHLDHALESALAQADRVVVDCTALRYISSHGMRTLLLHTKKARDRKKRLQIVLPRESPVYRFLLALGRPKYHWELHETWDSAEKSAAGGATD
jgi:anti-anti-sigma factor